MKFFSSKDDKSIAIPSLPDKEWLKSAKLSSQFTPDTALLESMSRHLVFIYGADMRKNNLHEKIIGYDPSAQFAYSGYTKDDFEVWKMWAEEATYPFALRPDYLYYRHIKDNDNFYAGISNQVGAPPAYIMGEVFVISTDHLKLLDKEYKNGLEFERVRTRIRIPYRIQGSDGHGGVKETDVLVHELKCWMYVGRREFFDELPMPDIAPVTIYKARNPIFKWFYLFLNKELPK